MEAPDRGADALLGQGSWTLKVGGNPGRGVRVPPSLNPSVTLSVRSCRVAGALLEPMLAGVSLRPLPVLATGLPRAPLPGSSEPNSKRCSSSAFGVSCNAGSSADREVEHVLSTRSAAALAQQSAPQHVSHVLGVVIARLGAYGIAEPVLQTRKGKRAEAGHAHRGFRRLRAIDDRQRLVEAGDHAAGDARPAELPGMHVLGRVHASVDGLLRYAPLRALHGAPSSCAECRTALTCRAASAALIPGQHGLMCLR